MVKMEFKTFRLLGLVTQWQAAQTWEFWEFLASVKHDRRSTVSIRHVGGDSLDPPSDSSGPPDGPPGI